MENQKDYFNNTANDGVVESLLAQLESTDLNQMAPVEIGKSFDSLGNEYQEQFGGFLDLREERATIIENRLEQMSLKQQQLLNSLESNRPSFLASPKQKALHQSKLAACQQRRITIESRIDRVKEYRSDLENNQDSFKKQFEKSLAAKKDDWFCTWQQEMIIVKKMMNQQNEIERQKKINQEQKKKLNQTPSIALPKIKLLQTLKIPK